MQQHIWNLKDMKTDGCDGSFDCKQGQDYPYHCMLSCRFMFIEKHSYISKPWLNVDL